MADIDLVQGSPEWVQARVGSLGASRIAEIITKTKSGDYGSGRANVMAELVCERLTGKPADKYITKAMEIGTELEPAARALYFFKTGNTVTEVGLIRHPRITQSHASPDGFVEPENGLLEIKCPQPNAHLSTLLSRTIPGPYQTQMMWAMACCPERDFCDYVSYNPNFPEHLKLWWVRLKRDEERIKQLEDEVAKFMWDMAAALVKLEHIYGDEAA